MCLSELLHKDGIKMECSLFSIKIKKKEETNVYTPKKFLKIFETIHSA